MAVTPGSRSEGAEKSETGREEETKKGALSRSLLKTMGAPGTSEKHATCFQELTFQGREVETLLRCLPPPTGGGVGPSIQVGCRALQN